MRRIIARALLVGAAALVVGATASMSAPAHPTERTFAAPEIIMVHGDLLPQPRFIADWEENHRLLLSVVSPVRPQQATQRGTFYLATRDAPARLVAGARSGVVSDSGLAVLRRHGVPVRLPAR